jgi:hypothetical protein
MKKNLLALIALLISANALHSETLYQKRLTFKDTKHAKLSYMIETINKETKLNFTKEDFLLIEDRDLATSHFSMYSQVVKGIPIANKSIRIWKKKGFLGINDKLIQAEMTVDTDAKLASQSKNKDKNKNKNLISYESTLFDAASLKSTDVSSKIMEQVKTIVKNSDDKQFMSSESLDQWINQDLVRTVTVKARRGKHIINVSLLTQKLVSSSYQEFPQDDITLPAKIYPIYEEAEETHEMLSRVDSELKYIHEEVAVADKDPYEVMRSKKYKGEKYDVLLAETEAGREQGYWSTPLLKRQAKSIADSIDKVENSFTNNGGLILDGKYATINLHPQAKVKFTGMNFKPAHSIQFIPWWVESGLDYEVIPQSGDLGKLIQSEEELLARPARRLADHDPTTYINDGFDEVQVYWAITTFVERLRKFGYTDKELSTRPFNAYLYDPDIGMRDNAYYTDDTINFTTYSPKAINFARDNSTIWHELGHGVMDRLMGDFIKLADTGGLSEGMADFCAALVVQSVMRDQQYPGNQDYRIINHTGFFLTNEVHDDGEAYGGTMRDILAASIMKYGQEAGLAKMTDLTMETMRLTRNNPGLTAQSWFSHMLFADERKSKYRRAGDMKDLILKSLAGRNFSMEGKDPANLVITNLNTNTLLTNTSPGSRENAIRLSMKPFETATYFLKIQLKSTDTYQFKYPVTVKLEFKKGALQGAIRWNGEERNPLIYTLNSENETVTIPVTAYGKCESINQEDGTCKDYAYVQIFNKDDTNKPSAKKRFYLRIKTKA